MVRCSPALMPMSCSSKPGMKEFEPITTAMSLAGAALERLAVDRAGEGDRDLVACRRFGALSLGQERPVPLGDGLHRVVDLGVRNLGSQPLQLDVLEVAELDLRQNLHRDRVVEIGLPSTTALIAASSVGSLTCGSIARRRLFSATIFAFASRTAASIASAIAERP